MESAASITRFDWTEENIAIARAGMEAGLSGGQIALKLGVTRNTVIGKMLRMGVKSANAKGHKPGVPAPWKSIPKPPRPNMMTINARIARPPVPPPIPIEEPVEALSEPPPTAKPFEDLLAGECRWPYGEATPYLFCAAPQHDGHSYCLGHCSIAHRVTPRLAKERQYEVAA